MKPEHPTVELVVPVLNEAHVLEKSVAVLRAFLHERFPFRATVLVADNGSDDGTDSIAAALSERFEDVSAISLPERGRGRALRKAWLESEADIVAYTDVDLSTELTTLEPMCRAIHEGGYDIATGSRLMPESDVVRGPKREIISRCYNALLRMVLRVGFSDAQCGFKAISREAAQALIPLVEDQAWFFDTELLVRGERLGWRIRDVPARWVDDEDSRVRIVPTAWEDIKGMLRLRRWLWSRDYRERAKGKS
jgi:glycosyltransferase involved in cell wall biosynthesis